MLISKNWISKFVTLPKSLTRQQLDDDITARCVEVEEIKDLSESLKGVIVAKILEISKHSNADKLQVTKVDTGKEILQVVCGAKNIAVGQHVPLATVGTFLPAMGVEIAKRDVRGVESCGMLCAGDELGLSSDHEGIMLLDTTTKLGTPLADVLGLNDWVIEVSNTSVTHRGDMWGHYGFAREIAALYKTKLATYKTTPLKAGKGVGLTVNKKDKKSIVRYSAVVLDNVVITSSPAWVVEALRSIGVASINNVVDASNYVMYELGQPTHAFDVTGADKINVEVARARNEEEFEVLGGKKLVLTDKDFVIKINGVTSALAGVIGGQASSVKETTNRILLESANFEHATIRQTASRYSLRTDAAMRFEKSLDPSMTVTALERVVEIIKETSPQAKIVSPVVDDSSYKQSALVIPVTLEYLQSYIGAPVKDKEVTSILTSLGFGVKQGKKGEYKVSVPSWRATKDVTMKQDIVEEVARMYGYDKITPTLPSIQVHRPHVDHVASLSRKLREMLAFGFDAHETNTISFIGEKTVQIFGENPQHFVRVTNPVAIGLELCRREILPGMISESVVNTYNHDAFGLFEIAKVFRKEEAGDEEILDSGVRLPAQDVHVAYMRYEKDSDSVFGHTKNIADIILHRLHFTPTFVVLPTQTSWLHPTRTRYIKIENEVIGVVSELHPDVAAKLKIKGRVGLCEFNLSKIAKWYSDDRLFKPIPRFPSIALDISMIVDQTLLWETIVEIAQSTTDARIENIELLDIFTGEKIGDKKKSVALRITYRDAEKTLELADAQKLHEAIKAKLVKELGAVIR
ncbi:phenylalanine--tRNA ligase subunit beta [Candidatus Falkowbacteria bacterium]|nr:phenylalanine--tRNA ligase subunit beta [Candidatus Falkowbacteria bacterium]